VFLRFVFTFWNYYVLKLLCLETIAFSDAMLSDINVVLCHFLSQYPFKHLQYISAHLIGYFKFFLSLHQNDMINDISLTCIFLTREKINIFLYQIRMLILVMKL
jgi:hypothetical protein